MFGLGERVRRAHLSTSRFSPSTERQERSVLMDKLIRSLHHVTAMVNNAHEHLNSYAKALGCVW